MKKDAKYKNPSRALPDMDFFKVYPSPMFEAMFDQHVSQVNTTTTYHGPLLYWLCRDVNAINALEIGMAQGWTSFFMAAAIKEECARQGANGMYYGVDIDDKSELVERMRERGAPVTFIHKDSLDLKPEDWDNKQFELIFQD